MRHFLPALAAVLVLSAAPAHAALNDTGQTDCYDDSNAVADCATVAADSGVRPRQDGRFGRDPAFTDGQFAKTGGGAAGFDFTPLDAAGDPIALNNGVPASVPACVRDNHTGLTWEVKTDDGGLRDKDWAYSWYDGSSGTADGGDNCFDSARCDTDKYEADVNAANLCGFNDWRLPTRRELLSIVHYGTSNPAIDTDFFPNTVSSWYWSSDEYAPAPAAAWFVYFDVGDSDADDKTFTGQVRLVRSGQ